MNYPSLAMAVWIEQNKHENREHLERDYKHHLGNEAERLMRTEVFNEKGFFRMRGFDPYRVADKCQQQRDFLFDEQGNAHDCIIARIHTMLCDGNFSWDSDIVKLYWAEQHGSNTRNSYPATWMWK